MVTTGQKIVLGLIGFLVIAILIFNLSKKLLCSHDSSVREVAFPLATAIIKHIEKNGVPESLKDIKGIPHTLKDCTKNVHKEEIYDYIDVEERELQYRG